MDLAYWTYVSFPRFFRLQGAAMRRENGVPKEEIIKGVLAKKLGCREAARELGVTPRSVHNYIRRFLERGPEGLRDRRKGNHRKLTHVDEAAIIAFKQERPQRSARLIRDRLGLKVTPEAVRLILVKYDFNLYRNAS